MRNRPTSFFSNLSKRTAIEIFLAAVFFFYLLFFASRFSNNSRVSNANGFDNVVDAIKFRTREGKIVLANFISTQPANEMFVSVPYDENGVEKEMKLFLMGTSTEPPFVATLADPKVEAASSEVNAIGDMETPTRKLFQYLLQEKCQEKDANGNPPLVIDAGANLGYFSTYSAVMGCRVVAFEPQPRLIPIIKTSWKVNSVASRTKLYQNILSENMEDRLGINLVNSMCWGCSEVTPAEADEVSHGNRFIITATRIDKNVDSDVLLMKVDVEGFEVRAIESAAQILANKRIENILIEWAPRRWQHSVERGTKLLENLYDSGYTVRHYDLRFTLPVGRIANEPESFPLIGKAWKIEREKLGLMNKFLKEEDSYGEANLWLTLDRKPKRKTQDIWG